MHPAELAFIVLQISIARAGETWQVSLGHEDPASQAKAARVHGIGLFDPKELSAQPSTSAYGRVLARQLFSDGPIKERLFQVESLAQMSGTPLRVLLSVDPSAQELLSLRWELLCHPKTDAPFATSEQVIFSRLTMSRDWRPVRMRAQGKLSAVIAIAAPAGPTFDRYSIPPVQFPAEQERALSQLGSIGSQTVGGPGTPLTRDRLVDALRADADILYLFVICRVLKNVPTMLIQSDSGDVARITADEFAAQLADLPRGPRLVVLGFIPNAANDDRRAYAALAERLSEAGVPAVVAMQGEIRSDTLSDLMPVFFAELGRHGRIDLALATARRTVALQEDAWMPVLYTRLRDGRLWYNPGFRGSDGADIWKKLLPAVRQGKVVPILGPGILEDVGGDSSALARSLSKMHDSPLAAQEWDDLPRVSQYLSVKESRFNVIRAVQKQMVGEMLALHRHWLPADVVANPPPLGKLLLLVGDHLRATRPTEVFSQLAKLQASTYLTTNYDPLMERALKASNREPAQVVSRWRHRKASAPAPERDPIPTADHPVVFHAFGLFGADDTLVLTEDDYFDYMIGTVSERLLPPSMESALCGNSLIFLGFHLADWRFRVLFRLLRSLPGRDLLRDYCHVAVQLDPQLQSMSDLEGAKAYLKQYFLAEAQIEIFFGSVEDFLSSLNEAVSRDDATDLPEDTDDGFPF